MGKCDRNVSRRWSSPYAPFVVFEGLAIVLLPRTAWQQTESADEPAFRTAAQQAQKTYECRIGGFPMGVALILYGVFAIVVLVFCTMSRGRPRVKYIAISMATLNHLGRAGRPGRRRPPRLRVCNNFRCPARARRGIKWLSGLGATTQHPGPLRME